MLQRSNSNEGNETIQTCTTLSEKTP